MRLLPLFASLCCVASAAPQVTLDRLSHVSAPPGAAVILFGQGFEPDPQIHISGIEATVIRATALEVEFLVPPNASSGFVTIETGGAAYVNPVPFTVTRLIQGTFNPPSGLTRNGYEVIADGTFLPVDTANGGFDAPVAREGVALLWAVRGALDPSFVAMVPPDSDSSVVDATSTAEALVLLNPTIDGRSLERYTNLVDRLRGLDEFTTLANLISSVGASGRDYLDDARVQDAWVLAIQALQNTPAPGISPLGKHGFETGTPVGTRLRYLDPPDTSDPNGIGLRRLRTTLSGRNSEFPDDYILKLHSADRFILSQNPVDWSVRLHELDANVFSNGFTSVDELGRLSLPARLSEAELDTATVSASLAAKNLDAIAFLASLARDVLFSRTVGDVPGLVKPDSMRLPALRSGVYMAEAYSGNLYHGVTLPFFENSGGQSQLITDLDGRVTWSAALGANTVIAAIDLYGGATGMNDLFKKALGDSGVKSKTTSDLASKLAWGVAKDVTKALAIHGNEPLSADVIYDLLKSTVASLIKNTAAEAIKAGADRTQSESLAARSFKMVVKSIDVMRKVSSIAQSVERATGLLADQVLAVERTVVVIGNPFAPRINSFFPIKGRGWEILKIHGANFSADTNELAVSFRLFANTADPNDATITLPLEIISSTPTTIAAVVPTEAYAAFPNRRAFVVVQRLSAERVGSSASLNPPYREFFFLAPPTITSVFPDPVLPGALLELRGAGFDLETSRDYEVLVDGISRSTGRMADLGGNRMGVVLPHDLQAGLHQIAIRLYGETSPEFPFTIRDPSYITPSGEPEGWGIYVNKADLSNAPDGKISVLEAFLIINNQLGREIEQHLPCELLAPSDPAYCPPQERETDFVSGDEPGRIRGQVNTIQFEGGLVFTGQFPELTSGDNFIFGQTLGSDVFPFTIDGSGGGAGPTGLLLVGTSEVRISGPLVIQNFSGHGIHLRNGAQGNFIEGVSIRDCGGDGILLEGDVTDNELRHTSADGVAGAAVRITGPAAQRNRLTSLRGGGFPPIPYEMIQNCGNGIRLENGAHFNTIVPGTIRNCLGPGIFVQGASNNFFGWLTEENLRRYDLVNNQTAGAYVGPNSVGNIFRYLNPINNQGDGVLLEGIGCSNNIVDRTFAGVNLYEGGTSLTLGNFGSGIRIANGAQFNLIGTRQMTIGQHGSISGNRDNGVLLEGEDTAFNVVNAQFIGVLDPYIGFQGIRFSANGRSGIALRNGAHDNIIGDGANDLANAIFACPDAGIELAGFGTDNNLVFGNQIGAFFNSWTLGEGHFARPRLGIWIHDGPRNNTLGLPGSQLTIPRFPGDPLGTPYHGWNAVNSCSEAGILVESAGGSVGTSGELEGANLIQANHVGELDNGNLAPSGEGAGLKLGPGAQANVIGGPAPELGNRIRGWYRAGLWIDQNHLPHPSLRNRIENNFIEGPGTGISFRFIDYLTATPSGGVGMLVSDSSGHAIGERRTTRNILQLNRIGIYVADSVSNSIQGFLVTNSYNAGITVRGGGGNTVGGDAASAGNHIHVTGIIGEPAWAGLALSHTTNNIVRANEVGITTAARGSRGILLTNAYANQLGGPYRPHGNTVIDNDSHGVVLSGPLTTDNLLFRNSVGRTPGGAAIPNRGDGVRIEGGANANSVGGLAEVFALVKNTLVPATLPAGNFIAYNEEAGVRVSGIDAVGNRILYNEITSNGDKGILHENGGNFSHPSPVLLGFDGVAVFGTVNDLDVTPPGSTIQVFSDPDPLDPEGDAFHGEGTVESNGTWRVVANPLHPIITMTATHAANGSTSEFGTGTPVSDLIGFRISRTDTATTGSLAAGTTDAAVLLLSLNAVNADVRVTDIAFDASGSLPDPTAITGVHLYHDTDADGMVSAADVPLGGSVAFGADNGRITFAGLNPVIEANTTQYWAVACSLAPAAAPGATFQLSLTQADAVAAKYVSLIGLDAEPLGNFAISSAEFTIATAPLGQTFAAWAAAFFSPAQLADPNVGGPGADPDDDGLPNLVEYAFNLNPTIPDRDTLPTDDQGIPHGAIATVTDPAPPRNFLDVTFIRRKEPVDITYSIEQSADLLTWVDATGIPPYLAAQDAVDVGAPGTLERITYRSADPIDGTAPRYLRVRIQPKP